MRGTPFSRVAQTTMHSSPVVHRRRLCLSLLTCRSMLLHSSSLVVMSTCVGNYRKHTYLVLYTTHTVSYPYGRPVRATILLRCIAWPPHSRTVDDSNVRGLHPLGPGIYYSPSRFLIFYPAVLPSSPDMPNFNCVRAHVAVVPSELDVTLDHFFL